MKHQVAQRKADVVQVVFIPCAKVNKQVVEHHHQQGTDHHALGQLFKLVGHLKSCGLPNPKRAFNGSSVLQTDVKLITARQHLHWKHKVLVHHGPLGKGLFVARVVLLQDLATRLVNHMNMVHEGNRHLDVAHHRHGARVGHLKAKPIRMGREPKVGRTPINGMPIGVRRGHFRDAKLAAGINQHAHVRTCIHTPWAGTRYIKNREARVARGDKAPLYWF